MLVRIIIRTVWLWNVSGIGPIGEGRVCLVSERGGRPPIGGTGAIDCAVAQVVTQCSLALEADAAAAAEAQKQKQKQKLNSQMARFMILFAEVPVEEAGNHMVDLARFREVRVVPKCVRQPIPHVQLGLHPGPDQRIV